VAEPPLRFLHSEAILIDLDALPREVLRQEPEV